MGAEPLLERASQLAALEDLVGSARSGSGAVALVRGEAGIGKTALLREVVRQARGAGMRTLEASAWELELDLAFGVARQLFEPLVLRAPDHELEDLLVGPALGAMQALGLATGPADTWRPAASIADEFSIFHGLYWLCANMAAREPVLVAVDDAHVADAASARWLTFLVRRIADLPMLVVAATRTVDSEPLDAILRWPQTTTIELAPVGPESVAEMIRHELDHEPDAGFSRACFHATGGNPFLAAELVRALPDAGIEPTAAHAGRIASMTPDSIRRDVLARLRRLPPDAAALAQAVAVLGGRAELRHAAELADLGIDAAARAADSLATARVLAPGRPLDFLHPIVRNVVAHDVPPGRRARAHVRAARILAAEAQPSARVATHLLAGEPAGDPWVVETLRRAAAEAAPEQAVSFLARALREPPPATERAGVLLELGEQETLAFAPLETAIGHLREGLAGVGEPTTRARAALALAGALLDAGAPGDALETIEVSIAELRALHAAPRCDEHELLLRCEATRLTAQDLLGRPPDAASFARLRELGGTGTSAGERVLLANLAYDALVVGMPAGEAAALAERALADGGLLAERLYFDHHVATWALEYADRLVSAEAAATAAVDEVRRRGSVGELIFALTVRGVVLCRRGALREAEDDARTALDLAAEHALGPTVVSFTWALYVDLLVDQGRLEDASAAVRTCGFEPDEPPSPVRAYYFHARGRLAAACGEPSAALKDFTIAGRIMRDQSVDHPAFYPWRSNGAVALQALGRGDEGQRLVDEELALARAWRAPRPTGAALRAAGLLAGGERGIALLRESAALLATSPARLDEARTLVELGAALRRGRHRSVAREPLLRGLDLAHRCGAVPLEARARDELRVLGARPRRALLSGVGSLTASELRVARLAAAGMTNRAIAQSLFVSMPTVEKHLGAVYRKLDVTSREDLPEALELDA